jgi:hypothetical protein
LKALGPIAIQGGSAGIAASRLIFEVAGLIGKGQKSAPLSKDDVLEADDS